MTKTDSNTQDSIWEKEAIEMAQKRTGNFYSNFRSKIGDFGVESSFLSTFQYFFVFGSLGLLSQLSQSQFTPLGFGSIFDATQIIQIFS